METGLGKKGLCSPKVEGESEWQESGSWSRYYTGSGGGEAGAKALGAVLGVLKQMLLDGLVRGAGRGPAGPDAWWPQK